MLNPKVDIWRFPTMEVAHNRWFIKENPPMNDWLVVLTISKKYESQWEG